MLRQSGVACKAKPEGVQSDVDDISSCKNGGLVIEKLFVAFILLLAQHLPWLACRLIPYVNKNAISHLFTYAQYTVGAWAFIF